jgi:hypothetical protein
MKRLAAFALCFVACADFDDLERNKPHDITVTVVDTYHFDGGTVSVPVPSGLGDVVVYVDNPDHGWTLVHSVWLDAGVALVEGVPPGFTLIARPDDPVLFSITSDDHSVDLGTDFLGPPGPLGSVNTIADFTGSGGAPTDGGTLVVARVPRFGITVDNVSAFAPPTFDPLKAASNGGFIFSHDWSQLPLLASEPVELVELPLQALDGGALLWSTATRGTGAATLSDGVNSTVNVALEDAPPGAVAGDAFDVSSLQQAMVANLPGGSPKGVWLRTLLSTGDSNSALTAQALFVPDAGGTVSMPPLRVDAMPNEAWTPLLQASVYVQTSVTVGAATETTVLAATTTGPSGDDSWHAQTLGPVTNLAVTDMTDLLSPIVTWSGTGTYFAVAVLALNLDSMGGLVSTPVDFDIVWEPKLHVRPNVLQLGTPYVFLVEAVDCGETARTAPLKTTPTNRCTTAYNLSLVYTPRSD